MNSAATSTSNCFMRLDVVQVLLGNLGDRNVVDVDVLLANQVEQQIQRPLVNLSHNDRERGFVRVLARCSLRRLRGAVYGEGLSVLSH